MTATPLHRRPRPAHVARGRAPARFVPIAALLGLIAAAGCTPDHTSRTFLLAPHEGHFAISGQVRLTGELADAVGDTLGEQVVDEASDVKVHIEGPADYRDSVLTHDGVFTFHVDEPGFYRVKCCVVSGDTAGHVDVVVAGDDTTQAGILTLGSPTGIIKTYPNPFSGGNGNGVGVESDLGPQHIEVFFSTLFGHRVWNYETDWPGGFLHVHWIGTDDAEQPVPDGFYWAVLHANGVYSYSLVEKRATPGPLAQAGAVRSRPAAR